MSRRGHETIVAAIINATATTIYNPTEGHIGRTNSDNTRRRIGWQAYSCLAIACRAAQPAVAPLLVGSLSDLT
jgi:hypothetical protein